MKPEIGMIVYFYDGNRRFYDDNNDLIERKCYVKHKITGEKQYQKRHE